MWEKGNLMSESLVDPVRWSAQKLVTLGAHVIHELAQNATAIDVSYRVLLGRCLLAAERTKLYQRFGCSGAIHYGTSRLGLGVKHARNLRRVAQALEELPQLSRAAETGEITWGKLREIVSKASLETESAWIALAKNRSDYDIQRLVRATEPGKLPWECQQPERPEVRIQLHLSAERGDLFERARACLSEKHGSPLSVTEALEHLVLEHLTSRELTTEVVKNAKLEARRDINSARQRHQCLIDDAKELVVGLSDTSQAVELALGIPSTLADDSGQTLEDPANCEDSLVAQPLSALFENLAQAGSSSIPPLDCEPHEECPARDTRAWQNPRVRYNPEARNASPAQRRELLRRDGYCCSTPGCPNRHWLHLHHLVPYAEQGPTQPKNLVSLCSACHKNLHDGHLHIVGDRDSGLTYQDAEGRDLAREHRIVVAGWINFWLGWRGGPEDCYIRRWAMVSNGAYQSEVA